MAAETSLQVLRVNHRQKVSEALESMLYEESLCDVTICAAGQQVKAHRVILAASSAYFKEIFSATLPNQYPIVFVKSITIEDLNAILEFMYKGEVTVPHQQLQSLVTSAGKSTSKGHFWYRFGGFWNTSCILFLCLLQCFVKCA